MIRGRFHPRSSTPIPIVQISLWLDGFSFTWAPVDFVIDTGAPVTCLSPRGASQVGISSFELADPSRWPITTRLVGVGGEASYFVTPVRYRFRHEDGRLREIAEYIRIAPWNPVNLQLPSLLGWDVLASIRLNIDWPQRSVELHEPTP